jgi:hypothetical protein
MCRLNLGLFGNKVFLEFAHELSLFFACLEATVTILAENKDVMCQKNRTNLLVSMNLRLIFS